jgi:hypothetical protein
MENPLNDASRKPMNVRALEKQLRKGGYCECHAAEIIEELLPGLRRLETSDQQDVLAEGFAFLWVEAQQSRVSLAVWLAEGGMESWGVAASLADLYGVNRSTVMRWLEDGLGVMLVGMLKAYKACLDRDGLAHVWEERLGRHFVVNCEHNQ